MLIQFFQELVDTEKGEDKEIFGEYKTRLYPPIVALALYVHKCMMPSGSYDKVLDKYQQSLPVEKIEKTSGHNAALFRAVRKFITTENIEVFIDKVLAKGQEAAQPKRVFKHYDVKLIDGTTVKMLDTKENQLEFPQHSQQEKGEGYPISRVSLMTNLQTGCIESLSCSSYQGKQTGEISLFKDHLNHINKRTLLLLDAYYDAFFVYHTLNQKGSKYMIQIKKHRNRYTTTPCGTYILVDKPSQCPHHIKLEEFVKLPQQIKLRISKGKTRNGKSIVICSNIPKDEASDEEIFAFSKERWCVEKDLKEFKSFLEAEFIVAKTPKVFLRELAAKVLGFNMMKVFMSLTKKSPKLFFYQSDQYLCRAFF